MADKIELTEMVADIVGAFVSKNPVAPADLPGLIHTVYSSLSSVGEPIGPAVQETPKATAAQIRKSITPEALISFEDGRPYKTLKRHLTTHGLSLDDYKAKWGLPHDYPSTAPAYSERRSAMAKTMGLGARGRGGGVVKAPAKGAAKADAARGRKPANAKT